jgi:hypothetical protein
VLPVGDTISVAWTLTAYSDPASFDSINVTQDLLNLAGPLPTDVFVTANGTATPEPGHDAVDRKRSDWDLLVPAAVAPQSCRLAYSQAFKREPLRYGVSGVLGITPHKSAPNCETAMPHCINMAVIHVTTTVEATTKKIAALARWSFQ